MSATSLGRLAALSTAQTGKTLRFSNSLDTEKATAKVAAAKEAADTAEQTPLAKLTALIPSEALSVYVAGLAAITTTNLKGSLAALSLLVMAVVVLNVLLTLISFKQTLGMWRLTLQSEKFYFAALLSSVALITYAFALPGNPFIKPEWAALILILGAPILTALALIGGLSPKSAAEEKADDAADNKAKQAAERAATKKAAN